jgi:hypothetical protein
MRYLFLVMLLVGAAAQVAASEQGADPGMLCHLDAGMLEIDTTMLLCCGVSQTPGRQIISKDALHMSKCSATPVEMPCWRCRGGGRLLGVRGVGGSTAGATPGR